MTVADALQEFYIKNNLPANGGENNDYFSVGFKLFNLKLPNTEARKKMIYIHDIQHALFDRDITWKGESFIAGFEISSGTWKTFPIGLLSIWTMGFGLLNYPKAILKGYKTGLKFNSLLNIPISKAETLNLSLNEIENMLLRKQPKTYKKSNYYIWCILSLAVILAPILLPIILMFLFV